MNTLKTVYNKLFKEETTLASHEVELGIIDDFTKEVNAAITNGDLIKKENTEIEKNLSTYFKLKSDLENQKKSLETNLQAIQTRIDNINVGYNRTNKIYQDLVNKASDLGIDYPKNIDVSFKNLEDLLKYTKSISTKNVKL
jgi:predicted  nucleic acid-binding Zn-ribbon protein